MDDHEIHSEITCSCLDFFGATWLSLLTDSTWKHFIPGYFVEKLSSFECRLAPSSSNLIARVGSKPSTERLYKNDSGVDKFMDKHFSCALCAHAGFHCHRSLDGQHVSPLVLMALILFASAILSVHAAQLSC